jgi:ABC-2 type transport system ATP-binding protein
VTVAEPKQLADAAALLEAKLGAATQTSVEGGQVSVLADTAKAANEAVAALVAAGIELTDFSMGQPSLDAVFFALTGHPAEEEAKEEETGK